MVEHVTDNDEVVGPIPTTRTDTKKSGAGHSFSRGASQSDVSAVAETARPGRENFGATAKKLFLTTNVSK